MADQSESTPSTGRNVKLSLLLLLLAGPPLFTTWVVFRRRPRTLVEIMLRALQSIPKILQNWTGRASIAYTHAPSPLEFRLKDGSATDLLKIVEQSVPPCQLNPLLFNGHVQTFWTAKKIAGPPIYYKRKIFDSDHQIYRGTFAVDFVVAKYDVPIDRSLPPRTAFFQEEEWTQFSQSNDGRPMLVVLHGLSGGSYELYLREAIYPLVQSGKWEICVVNSRGCAKSSITSGILFNARATWDVRQVVNWIRRQYPKRPVFGVGFSLGANILTNYVGEEGRNCYLKAAMSCGNPFNLEIAHKALLRTLLGKEVYQRAMGANLKRLINLHKNEVEKFTKLDLNEINNVTYLYEFDRAVQCHSWGYPTEDSYYRDASSTDSILSIRIPYVALSALDDPIAVSEAIPYGEIGLNPCTILCTSSLGGHLSWFEPGGGRWHAKPICNFLNLMAFEVDLDSIHPSPVPRVSETPSRGPHYHPMRRRMEIASPE